MTDSDYLYGWTVYRNPSDFPDRHVVRRWRVGRGGAEEQERDPWTVCETLEQARASVPEGLFCLPRKPDDDPVIVEVWL